MSVMSHSQYISVHSKYFNAVFKCDVQTLDLDMCDQNDQLHRFS